MAFLDNSGDIILDAVLTDAGRKRLARGDGTFKITKYAFGDDEINYGSYDPNAASGSAYFDLEVLQTPVLEAFTNNRSSLKSRLISLTNNNLLFLPEMVLNEVYELSQRSPDSTIASGSFVVSVNKETTDSLITNVTNLNQNKFLLGYGPATSGDRYVRVDQGLNSTKLDGTEALSAELTERQYLLTIDNRFGMFIDSNGNSPTPASPSFIDDDQIATYYMTQTNTTSFIENCAQGQIEVVGNNQYVGGSPEYETLPGPRGTKLFFGIKVSDNLKFSDYLFDTIGRTVTDTDTFLIIDATVKVVGVTTGYQIDIPVTFVKKQNT